MAGSISLARVPASDIPILSGGIIAVRPLYQSYFDTAFFVVIHDQHGHYVRNGTFCRTAAVRNAAFGSNSMRKVSVVVLEVAIDPLDNSLQLYCDVQLQPI